MTNIEKDIFAKVHDAEVIAEPFPHLSVDSIFPEEYYREILKNYPKPPSFTKTSPGYDDRLMFSLHNPEEIDGLAADIREFWRNLSTFILSYDFLQLILSKFQPHLDQRFNGVQQDYFPTADLVLDKSEYFLGPHTDHADKVASVLLYFPDDASMPHLGTKMYEPLDTEFKDFAGAHHKFEDFRKVGAVEYRPNILFSFFKTDDSFHGVERVVEKVERKLLMYNIRIPAEAVPQSQRIHVHGPL